MSNWGSDLPKGHARGVAYWLFKRVATAQVIEISHSDAGIKLLKAYAAVDVGIALDRRNIEAQVQGGLTFGLCAAIFGEITVTGGVVDQTNFHAYPLLQMYQAPSIEVRVHERGRQIRGVGEAATPTAAPALGNAIFAATGKRIRELPFGKVFRFV
jgi:isoquinoline 1-oxidoreductase beta subunit